MHTNIYLRENNKMSILHNVNSKHGHICLACRSTPLVDFRPVIDFIPESAYENCCNDVFYKLPDDLLWYLCSLDNTESPINPFTITNICGPQPLDLFSKTLSEWLGRIMALSEKDITDNYLLYHMIHSDYRYPPCNSWRADILDTIQYIINLVKVIKDSGRVLVIIGYCTDVNSRIIEGSLTLLEEICNHQKALVKWLIENGSDVNALDREPWHEAVGDPELPEYDIYQRNLTCLHWAVISLNNEEIIEMLIRAGAKIDAEDIDGATPLHHAYGKMLGRLIQIIMKVGCSLEWKTSRMESVFHIAASNGCPEAIMYLSRHSHMIDDVDANGLTPLRRAIRGKAQIKYDIGDEECMRINKSSPNWEMCTRCLIELGAKWDDRLTIEDARKYDASSVFRPLMNTPYHDAVIKGDIGLLRKLLASLNDNIPCQNSYITIIDSIQCMNPIDAKDYDGHSPLFVAVLRNSMEAAEALINYGANVNAFEGWELQTVSGCDEVVDYNGDIHDMYLRPEFGSEVEVIPTNITPIRHAAKMGHSEMVALLSKANAKL